MKWSPSTELQFLKGVGPKYAEFLRKKGLYDFKDLVEFYPRAYQDLSFNKKIADLSEGETVSLSLKVVNIKRQQISKFKSITSIVLTDGVDTLQAKYFKPPYRGFFNQFEAGAKVQISGKVKFYKNSFEIVHPDTSFIKNDDESTEQKNEKSHKQEVTTGITPVYSESDGLSQKKIQTLIGNVFKNLDDEFKQTGNVTNPWLYPLVPKEIQEHYKLLDRWTAIKQVHTPPEGADIKTYTEQRTRAHLTLIFEELFVLEMLTALRKEHYVKAKTQPLTDSQKYLDEFTKTIPFQLTNDQLKSLNDIKEDFEKGHPMHRLVQGDVGSGKTLVALASAYAAIKNGKQVAIMAPTEILAQQHLENVKKYLEPLNIKAACLTGKVKESERKEIEQGLLSQNIDLLVGTHALFEDRVQFKNLAFVIVDEQHRFGVHQRQKLKDKGHHPHFLVMTATPIPRTLTMTVYGDLDVSLIEEMPPGRTPVKTKKFYQKERSLALSSVEEELKKGRQAYFVFPLVADSETLDLKSAEFEFEELTKHFKDYNVGLLHGRMKSQEKEEVMEAFRENKTQVLVSTTVIEVGVDVPNATVMVIENCERFGLSQLHQLRGRVGRGEHAGQCFVILGNKFSQESLHRAKIMEQTTNGFTIAEEDLKLRGPGEVLGARQSGLPAFKLADLLKHHKVLVEARKAAFAWVKNPKSREHIKEIKRMFKHKLDLVNVS